MADMQELEGALRKAHAAGNSDHARAFAAEIQKLRGGDQSAPADFSGVTSSSESTADGRMADGWKAGHGRDAMMGARSVLQGAGGLVGALGGDAFNQAIVNPVARAVGASEAPSYREVGAQLSDRLNLPKPQNASERVQADVGEAMTGTGLTMGAGGLMSLGRGAIQHAPAATSRLASLLTAQPGMQAVSTAAGAGAGSAVREGGGSQGQQLAASLVGGLSPAVGTTVPGAALRGITRGRSGAGMQRTIDDFAALGATPSVGQASGNKLIQGGENILAGGPTSASVMGSAAKRQAETIGEGLQKRADDYMPNASAERAGRAVERGVDTFAGNVNATRRALYWNADRLIPESTTLPMTRTQQALDELTALTPGAESTTAVMVNPKIARLAETVGEDMFAARATGTGGIPYTAVKDIRSRIGKELSDYSLTTDKPTAEYKRLYAALSQDMEEAARREGPEAVRAVKRANNYFKASASRLEQVERVVDKNGGPEKIYNAVMAGTRDGGTTLRSVMQSLPNEGQKAVTAAVIKRMGMANPGAQSDVGDVFSAATFLTNWNKVSPEARKALFNRHGPQFSRDMDRIARVASNIKDGAKLFANPSGTAPLAAGITYGTSLVASLFDPSFASTGLLVSGGAAANVMARTLTNPRAVKWLSRTTETPLGAIPATINSMRAAGEREGDEDLLELAGELEQRVQQSRGAGDQQ